MSIDDRLRTAARDVVQAPDPSPAPPTSTFETRMRVRTALAAATTVTALVVLMFVVTELGAPSRETVTELPALPRTELAETDPTIVPPSSPTTRVVLSDGFAGIDDLPAGFLDPLSSDGNQLLLAEDGAVLAAFRFEDASGGEYWNLAVDPTFDLTFMLTTDTPAEEMPEVWVGFGVDNGDSSVVVFGLVPGGVEVVSVSLGEKNILRTTAVFERTNVERSVFVGVVDESVFTTIKNGPLRVLTTDDNGISTVTEIWGVGMAGDAEGYNGLVTFDMFEPPLIVGVHSTGEAPDVVLCESGTGFALPNRSGTIEGGPVFPFPDLALRAFLRDSDEDPPLPQAGYLEIPLVDEAWVYGVDGAGGFVTVITVSQTLDGWSVTSWEASGC